MIYWARLALLMSDFYAWHIELVHRVLAIAVQDVSMTLHIRRRIYILATTQLGNNFSKSWDTKAGKL